tara:strand:- start:1157 stop:3136 length:1980 start_codon:yes stop_codon:yes gene_type:complete
MAKDFSISSKVLDTDKYVYREERDLAKTQVDWGTISKNLTDTINTVRDDRETQKSEIEKANIEEMNRAGEFDQYNNKTLNESVLEGSEWAKNALSVQMDLVRRGLVTPGENQRYQQRVSDSFTFLKKNLGSFEADFNENNRRAEENESTTLEQAINGSVAGLGVLKNWNLSGNAATGELAYVRVGNDPKTGEPYDANNPANQASLGSIGVRATNRTDYTSTTEMAQAEVGSLAEVISSTLLDNQAVRSIEDWRQLDQSEEMMTGLVKTLTSTTGKMASIAQDKLGFTAEAYKQDWTDKELAEDPDRVRLIPDPSGSGDLKVDYSPEQIARIEEAARLALESQIDQKIKKVKGFTEQKQSNLEAGQTREIDIAHGYMNSLRDFIILGEAGASSGAQNLVNEVNKNLAEGDSRIETIDREVDDEGNVTSFIIRRADKTSKPINIKGMSTTQAMRALYGGATPKGSPWNVALDAYDIDMSNDDFGKGAAGGTGSLEDYPTIDAAASRSLGGSEQTPLSYIQAELGGDINNLNDPQVQIKEVYENVIQAILPSEMYDDVMSTDTGQGDGGIRLEFPTETTTIDGVSYEPGDMVIRIGKTTGKIPDYKGGAEWTDDKTIFQYDIIKDIANEERARLEESRFGTSGGGVEEVEEEVVTRQPLPGT